MLEIRAIGLVVECGKERTQSTQMMDERRGPSAFSGSARKMLLSKRGFVGNDQQLRHDRFIFIIRR